MCDVCFVSNMYYTTEMSYNRSILHFNPLIATLKPHSNGPSYSNTVIDRLTVDGWVVTFGTARRELGGAPARPGPS